MTGVVDELGNALNAAKISTSSLAPGNYRVPCPRCEKGKHDDALSVDINDDFGFFGQCFRCKWAFGWHPSDPTPDSPTRISPSAGRKRERRSTLEPKWRQFWDACLPITENCTAGQYLKRRRCSLRGHDLRWRPSHWHPAAKREFPCMVALITSYRTAEPVSLHFTYLANDGSDKAPVDRPRLYLGGHTSRGVVRLCPDDAIGQGLIIGEGLETCLSAALEFDCVWSCLDAGGIEALPIFSGISGLTVLVDNDDAGREAFAKVCTRYEAADIEVIGVEVAGEPGADLNDLVRGAA